MSAQNMPTKMFRKPLTPLMMKVQKVQCSFLCCGYKCCYRKPEYIQIHSVFEQMDTLRASGSMPFVSKPVAIGDKKYLDGGIADSIPFEWLAGQDCDKLIVILTRDMEYRRNQCLGLS